MAQMHLFQDPKPLDQRLGRKFFRRAPRRPGVYVMKDADDNVLYVGKARDLKRRLNNYRLANPDRMPRRHLRMVREVARIEFQFCANESAALRRESKLLRSLKPKFNRAGVWPGRPKFITWRMADDILKISVVETPAPDWQRFGPLGGGATYLQRSIARLIWLAVNPEKVVGEMPAGWSRGEFMEMAMIQCGSAAAEVKRALECFFWEDAERFALWLGEKVSRRNNQFERRVIETELENLTEFNLKHRANCGCRQQLALL